MSATQHQHYLPQSYQRGWADGNKQVYVYEWRHNRIVCAPKSTKSTGGREGLYYIPMALPQHRNVMEDDFWKGIDQWGADGLALLRTNDPAAATKLHRDRLAIFIMSFEFRNPRKIAELEARARQQVLASCETHGYAAYRRPHEPDTFGEFVVALEQPGLTELGARLLRHLVFNPAIRAQLLSMEWHVVTVSNDVPILTSDVPLIRHKGLKEHDGMLILPLSATEFFVAFNGNGPIDMGRSINENIQSRAFVEAINKYVVRNKIDFVYGIDGNQIDFVSRYWAVSEVAT